MLNSKVEQLERDVVTAHRIASFWRKQIDLYGEQKAEGFYRLLGLNHLESKSVEWEGLKLSRQPNEVEKQCVKGIAEAQDAGQKSVTNDLLKLRAGLIRSGLETIRELPPAEYYTLTLTPGSSTDLRASLESVFKTGRKLVAQELSGQKRAVPLLTDDDEDELDEITDLAVSRVVNDTQAKIAEAVARYRLMGLRGAALWQAVDDEMERGSVAYIERLARGTSARVLNFGRAREAEDRNDEWQTVEYSALLDPNVCGPCAVDDGQSASNESDLTPVPNPECEGGDFCRCFHVFVFDTVA